MHDSRMIKKKKARKRMMVLLFILPAFIVYTLFMFIPLITSLPISLFSYTGIGDMKFIGIDNYVKLFTAQPFCIRIWNALKNNIVWFFISMVVQNGFALLLAVFVSKKIRFRKFFRTLYFIPTTISVVMVGFVFTLLLNPQYGIIHHIFSSINEDIAYFPWLGSQGTALICIAIANAWQYIGIPFIVFCSAIDNISSDVTDASLIDGCDERQQFRYVTFPLLLPSIGMISVITFVGDFSGFELVYSMEGTLAGPNYATDLLGTFFYRVAFGAYGGAASDMGLGAAIASFMFLVIGIGVVIWLVYDARVQKRLDL